MTSRFATAVGDSVGEHQCVVALGGGADSAVLLHATREAAQNGAIRAVFAFHALASSHLLRDAARDLTDHLEVNLTVLDVPIVDGPDLEARARHARYEAIEANIGDEELVLTGHSANDQAETVLMRLMRGSGAGGLAGIPARRGPWRRPFLAFTRRELRSEAERHSLPFVDDPANEDERFLRSRVRHGLLPEIERNYAPAISTDLTRTAKLLGRDDDVLTSMATRIVVSSAPTGVTLPAATLVTSSFPVASRAIRRALRTCGDAYPGSMDDVEAILEVARTGSAVVVGGGIHVRRDLPMIVLSTSDAEPCTPPRKLAGLSAFGWGRHSYRVERHTYPVAQRTAGRFTVIAAPPGGEIAIRSVGVGDRIDIGTGSTPVTELLRDHGVPESSRSCWLLITINGKIGAVHGVRTAAWATPDNGDDIMIIEQEVHS